MADGGGDVEGGGGGHGGDNCDNDGVADRDGGGGAGGGGECVLSKSYTLLDIRKHNFSHILAMGP